MKTNICLRISCRVFFLSIFLSICGWEVFAYGQEEIIGRIGLEEARDWVDINRQILNHPSVDKVTRGRMRRELEMLHKRLTTLRENLGDSAVDEVQRSIIGGCLQDIDRLLDTESSRVNAGFSSDAGGKEKKDTAEKERQKYQQLVNVLSALQELKDYRDEVKQTVKVVRDAFYGSNAEETLRKSFEEAGCNEEHYKAWGGWMYVECWDTLKKHDNARIAIEESIRDVEESCSADPAGMNRIRREIKKWRTDHQQLMRLMNQIVKLYTEKGLVLQKRRGLDWKDKAGYKQLTDKMENIQGEINTLQAMVKEPGRLEPFPSLKQEDASKDPNQEPQPRPLEEVVATPDLNADSDQTKETSPAIEKESGPVDTPSVEADDTDVRTVERTLPDGRKATVTVRSTRLGDTVMSKFEDWQFEDGSRETRTWNWTGSRWNLRRVVVLDSSGNIVEMTINSYGRDGRRCRERRWHAGGYDTTYHGIQDHSVRRDTAGNLIECEID